MKKNGTQYKTPCKLYTLGYNRRRGISIAGGGAEALVNIFNQKNSFSSIKTSEQCQIFNDDLSSFHHNLQQVY